MLNQVFITYLKVYVNLTFESMFSAREPLSIRVLCHALCTMQELHAK